MAALAGRAGSGPAALRLPLTPGRPTRIAVGAFLVALVVLGVHGTELWPFSRFQLFSHVRSGQEVRWDLVSVSATGAERRVDFATLPRGYRHGDHVLGFIATGSAARRREACRAWHAVLTAERLRVYRVAMRSAEPGRPFVEERRFVFDCAEASR